MHRVFSFQDIIREISQYLIFADLVRFSQTSKSIHFTISERVWKNQESMTSLLAVLPAALMVPEPIEKMRLSLTPGSVSFPDELVALIPFDLRILRPDLEAALGTSNSAPEADPSEVAANDGNSSGTATDVPMTEGDVATESHDADNTSRSTEEATTSQAGRPQNSVSDDVPVHGADQRVLVCI